MADDAPHYPTSAFDYDLPPDLIAHYPAAERDASRLLVLQRDTGAIEHRVFRDLVDLVQPGDVIVVNETRVIPARLIGQRAGGGAAEVVLLFADEAAFGEWSHDWTALVRPGARLRTGRRITVADDLDIEVLDVLPDGTRRIRLHTPLPVREAIEKHGRLPLPPYIERDVAASDTERYQTVFAAAEGSIAAPTAGLHFTPALLDELRARGVHIVTIVLHVGVGTFRPVEVEDPGLHQMHEERWAVTADTAERINAARGAGGRVWAVGTTVARALETAATAAFERRMSGGAEGFDGGVEERITAGAGGFISPGSGWTRLFIRPGYEFRVVDCMITNFHLPRSTLLMLVSAFAGYDSTMNAYREAVAQRYRFFSYGDAMAIL